jgi:hypothetical protein
MTPMELHLFSPNLFSVNIINFSRGGRGEGEENSLAKVTLNSKEKNSKDFYPNYAKEFGLLIHLSLYT